MKTDDIKKRVEAFYNGETTAEDEQVLRNYFNSNKVADELIDEKDFFIQLHDAESVEIPSALESKLENLIDNLAEQEKNEGQNIVAPKPKRIPLIGWIGSAAAGFALLISVGLYFNEKSNITTPIVAGQHQLKDTYNNPDIAYAEAQKALALLSTNFNKGVDQVATVSENLEKTNEILNRTFKRKKNNDS